MKINNGLLLGGSDVLSEGKHYKPKPSLALSLLPLPCLVVTEQFQNGDHGLCLHALYFTDFLVLFSQIFLTKTHLLRKLKYLFKSYISNNCIAIVDKKRRK